MRSRSAALELTLLAVFVMAVLLVSFAWLCLRWERAWLLQEVQHGLSLASDTLHSSLRLGMMHREREEILGTIERVARDTRIRRIRIMEHKGRVGLSTQDSDLHQIVDRSSASCTICHAGGEKAASRGTLAPEARTILEGSTMRAFTPVLAEPGCVTAACHHEDASSGVLGVIDLSLSLEEVEEAFARSQIELGILALAAIVLGGGLLWLALARRFRRPMRDLLRGIRRLAAGELDYRIPARTRDEFGELAESFNSMSQQLTTVRRGLIQSERLISMGKLAAGVAHEINNPLTGILSYAEDLLEETDTDDSRRKDCEVIVHEALRCRQIVRSLLEFARQDAPSLARVSPRDLIARTLDVVIRQATFRNIRFEQCIEEDLTAIEADPVQIQQVLVNLIINAQQAMPDGGTIVLGARSMDGGIRVEFSVKDEGSGIPPELHSRIFDPFFSTKGGKTDGLGLAVSQGIVRQHGGTVRLESELGKGTIFRVVLPVSGIRGLQEHRKGTESRHA